MADLPARMTAIGIKRAGRPGRAGAASSAPCRSPAQGEILVKVAAAGVNRPDVLQRQGNLSAAARRAGYSGPRDRRRSRRARRRRQALEGRRQGHGAGRRRRLCRIRGRAREQRTAGASGLSMIEAAAIPETFFTVWHNVFERGALKAGETLLCMAARPASAPPRSSSPKRSARSVIVTAGSEEKCEACRKLGADVAINYKTRGLRRRDQEGDRRQGRRTSSSTWSAATTSSAITRPPRSMAASCRSRSSGRRRRRSTSAA